MHGNMNVKCCFLCTVMELGNVTHGTICCCSLGDLSCTLVQDSKTCMKFTTAEYTVKKTPDDGQRKCPKHVEFYNRINLDN